MRRDVGKRRGNLHAMWQNINWKCQSRGKARQEYRRLNKKLQRTTEETRENGGTRNVKKHKELDDLQQKGRFDKVYENVKQITRKLRRNRG